MFTTDPGMVPMTDHADLWYLDGPLIWVQPMLTITIPAGFISDDASIPHMLDWIPYLDRSGPSRRPGILHDGIYSIGRERGKDFADSILEVACMAEGMSAGEAATYHDAVHYFGQSSWDKDARVGTQGVSSGDFITTAAYEAFKTQGGSIYTQGHI